MRVSGVFVKSVLLNVVILCTAIPALGQHTDDSLRLMGIARDLWAPVELSAIGGNDTALTTSGAIKRIGQATLFLEAALEMDPANHFAWNDIYQLLTSAGIDDAVRGYEAIIQYSQLRPNDNIPVENWINYNLSHLNTRKEREEFLFNKMVPSLGSYPMVLSNAYKRLGAFALEKSMIDSLPPLPEDQEAGGIRIGAREFFATASTVDIFNDDAMEQYLLLSDSIMDSILSGQARIEGEELKALKRVVSTTIRWRMRLRNNPFDLQATLNLIDVLMGAGYFNTALDYYEHAIKLLTSQGDIKALKPAQQQLLTNLQFAYLVSIFRSGDMERCLAAADKVISRGQGGLRIATVRAMAIGGLKSQAVQAEKMLQEAITASKKLPDSIGGDYIDRLKELAWYYCFISPKPTEALDYSRKAVMLAPGDIEANECLAYAHALNAKPQEAEKALARLDETSLAVQLTQSLILEVAGKDKQAVYDKLIGINMNEAGLLAGQIEKKIGQLQKELGLSVEPIVYGRGTEYLTGNIQKIFGDAKDLNVAFTPGSFIRCNINLDRDSFSFGDPMIAELSLSNAQKLPLRIAPDGFVDPYLLIIADVQPIVSRGSKAGPSGGRKQFYLSQRYLSQGRMLESNTVVTKKESLNIGPLRQMLSQHPQQSYQITFRGILDPVSNGRGGFVGKIPSIQPRPVTVFRYGYIPSRDKLSFQCKMLRSGNVSERLESTRILCALLSEEQLAKKGKLIYTPGPIGSKKIIKDGLVENLSSKNDFRLRAWTAYYVNSLPPTLANTLAAPLGKLLTDEHWFVRFMSMHTMQSLTDMSDFFKWAVDNDANQTNKRQIQLWLGKPWQVQDKPQVEK